MITSDLNQEEDTSSQNSSSDSQRSSTEESVPNVSFEDLGSFTKNDKNDFEKK
jgi:hypothetical protein